MDLGQTIYLQELWIKRNCLIILIISKKVNIIIQVCHVLYITCILQKFLNNHVLNLRDIKKIVTIICLFSMIRYKVMVGKSTKNYNAKQV